MLSFAHHLNLCAHFSNLISKSCGGLYLSGANSSHVSDVVNTVALVGTVESLDLSNPVEFYATTSPILKKESQ